MSDVNPIDPPELAKPGGHYAHGTIANGFVFVSGQLPIAPDGRKLNDASFAEQAKQVLANVEAILKASGSGTDRLVQVRVYVDDLAHWPEFNTIYAAWIGDHRPSRAVVPTAPLHYGFRIEVEAVATIGPDT
jgi:2-iminobutanoate/2-iminopropanoate deaminase